MSNFLSLLKDAIVGKQEDFTSIGLKRAIVLLAVPMIFEMFMESLFAVVDIYFVGKLGAQAVATVGLTESVLTIVYSLGFGISMAATAMVARRVGEKNFEAANNISAQVIYVGLFFGFIISVIGIFFSENILRMLDASEEVVQNGKSYTQWMLGGNFVILFLFLLNGVFRGAGNASIAMRMLIISNAINIVLDPLLILGIGPFPECGLVGAAYATNIGRGTAVLVQLYILFNGKALVKVALNHLQLQWKIILKLLDISAGGTGQFIIASSSWIFLMKIMAAFGDEALAGYTIGIRVLIFTILPAWGMANAAATLVGQNLGANKPSRAEKSVWLTGRYNMVFLGSVSIIYFFLAPEIIGIFTQDVNVLNEGVDCLRFLSAGYIFFAYGMVIAQAFNGAGDTRTPTWLNLFAFWGIQIPLAYVLAKIFDIGPIGVYVSVLVAESLLALTAIYIFKKGKWKKVQV